MLKVLETKKVSFFSNVFQTSSSKLDSIIESFLHHSGAFRQDKSCKSLKMPSPSRKTFVLPLLVVEFQDTHFNSTILNIANDSKKMSFDYCFIRQRVHPEVSRIKNSIQVVLFTF